MKIQLVNTENTEEIQLHTDILNFNINLAQDFNIFNKTRHELVLVSSFMCYIYHFERNGFCRCNSITGISRTYYRLICKRFLHLLKPV